MILDTSAIVAVMRGEDEAETFAALIEDSAAIAISAATLLETSVVVGSTRHALLDEWLETAGVDVVAFDAHQARLARAGYARYGKGSGSRAGLNLGDCFSYALAKATGRPLLFKGEDFSHTDIAVAGQR